MSDNLKKIGLENIPKNYQEIAKQSIQAENDAAVGKVRYNDKILHQSKIIKFYLENENEKKTQKDIDKIYKKIIKNKKYFFSAKDLALTKALVKDGFSEDSAAKEIADLVFKETGIDPDYGFDEEE